MEKLLSKLQAQVRAHPTNPILRRILPEFHYLLNSARPDFTSVKLKFDQLQHDLDMLATEGYWEPSKEDEDSLRELKKKFGLLSDTGGDTHSTNSRMDGVGSDASSRASSRASSQDPGNRVPRSSRDRPIVQPPPLSTPLLPVSTTTPTVLPVELVEALNQTFFLHLLVTDPQRVLPPGKSLVSMLSAPRSNATAQGEQTAQLEARVKDMVHSAFWKEVRTSRSSLPYLTYTDVFGRGPDTGPGVSVKLFGRHTATSAPAIVRRSAGCCETPASREAPRYCYALSPVVTVVRTTALHGSAFARDTYCAT